MSPLVARHALPWAEELLSTFPAVVVQGARQIGKSTFARLLVDDRPHLSVTLDDDATRAAASLDPRGFVEQAGERTLIVDEIQRDPALLLAMKASIDERRHPGRFVLTGSSDLLRLSRTPDSLAGRAATIELGGFSQGELLGVRDDFASWVRNAPNPGEGAPSEWSRVDYIDALARGGYPEAQGLSERLRNAWFDSYLERLLKRDIGDVSRGLSSDRLESAVRLIAANQSGELVPARLADALGMPKSSIAAYLAGLSALYLTNDLPPWRANLTKREIGRRKTSVTDSGLALRLAKLRPSALEAITSAPALGMQLEAFVVGELLKQRGWSAEEYELFRFRDRDGLEVDVVIEFSDGKVLLIEVKASESYRREHIAPIRRLADRLGDRFLGGAVLSLDRQRRRLSDRVWGLPISTLWQH